MNSTDLIQNLKYYGKFLSIIVIVFLLLKFVINLKLYESLLLALIITVSILIIENIIYINDIASDPLNCDQCKVNIVEINEDVNNNDTLNLNMLNNIVPNPLAESQAEMEQQLSKTLNNNTDKLEPFISDTLEKIIDNVSSTFKKDSTQLNDIVNNDIYELKCIKTNKNNNNNSQDVNPSTIKTNELEELKKSLEILKRDNEILKLQNQQNQQNQQTQQSQQTNTKNNNIVEGFGNLNELENFIGEQQTQNKNLMNKLKSEPNIQANMDKIKNTIVQQLQSKELKQTEEALENPYIARAGLLNEPEQLNKLDSKPKLNPNSEYNLDSPITYDAGYVVYQENGLQKQENDVSFDNTLFKMGVGQQNIVKPFMRDGADYYRRIQSYSSKAPTPSQALNSELRYGDYNYISPLNSGMTNSDYTFVSPNNWFPVPPHPPVCVTNKQCTTCPIQISDGNDYMNWASLEDFDKARRFTGNMGINIDYVKNVLNNDEGY